ncbi:serine hydrolase domain-containing protein [Flavobacterium sp. ST-75]|uniref:Serine hydrolase domain-containing protein n=1 Tax=Flavobacterium rhizophilum TaxID=3163296 RepID=A0ABW8Y7L6_9FLAO
MYKLIVAIVFFIPLSAVAQHFDVNKLDTYFDTIVSTNKGLGEISIAVKDSVYYYRKFGTSGAYIEKEPNIYQIGSVTKVLTSILVLQLIEEQQISLEDKIEKYFPKIPNASNISIDNLLSHTSGLNDFVVKNDTSFYWLREPVSDNEIMQEIQRQGTLFESGEDVLYSNSGYYLLAKIVEQERKMSYKEALSDYITEPLGLDKQDLLM